ncbi:hypothetical protein [Pseudomonas sp. BIC9C]|uniref:hypothetical protein n=1 Tax=Pseudomonas sp. BIC9C TaxID=3078458 RepID=UPI002AD50067|nr:hypothetical protein [Pseudomonas sp. BIC9C]
MSKRIGPATALLTAHVEPTAEELSAQERRAEKRRRFNELIQRSILTGVGLSISKRQDPDDSPLFEAAMRFFDVRAELYECLRNSEQFGKVAALDIAFGELFREAVIPRAKEVRQRLDTANEKRARKNSPQKIKALKLAEQYWAEDHEQRVLIGAMAERIFNHIRETKEDGDFVPKPKTLRGWLRDIAPDYGRKRGAPRKC